MFTLTDYLTLQELVTRALPRLQFSIPDYALAGHELLWLLNAVGARLEYDKLEASS